MVAYDAAVRTHLAGGTPLAVYQLDPVTPGSAADIAGVRQLTSLQMSFSARAIVDGGLIGTETGCVKDNNPGPNGEYRNGALLVQAIKAPGTTTTINGSGSSTAPIYGLGVDGDTSATRIVLWESTIFWHWKPDPGLCYGDTGYQAQYDACITGTLADICDCLDKPNDISFCPSFDGDSDNDNILDVDDNCPLVPNQDQTDVDPANGVGDACEEIATTVTPPNSVTCSNAAANPNPVELKLEFKNSLCPSTTSNYAEFEFELKHDNEGEVFTFELEHDGSSSPDSITFSTTSTLAKTTVGDIEFDLLSLDRSDLKKFKKIRIRNTTTSSFEIKKVTVSWAGGPSGQKYKKTKEKVLSKAATGDDFKYDPEEDSGFQVSVSDVDLPVIVASGSCSAEYTLEIEYHETNESGANVAVFTDSLSFDESLGGSAGDPIEIDFSSADLDNGLKKVDTIYLEATGNKSYIIDKITIS